jgi:hypothetical protein
VTKCVFFINTELLRSWPVVWLKFVVRRFDEIDRLISHCLWLYTAPEEQRVYRQLVKLLLAPEELPECL